MKKIFTKALITSLIFICGLALNIPASAQTINLSGTWKRNDQKTDGGGLSTNSVAAQLEISQDKSAMTIKGTNKNGKGEISTYIDILKLDGSSYERIAVTDDKKTITPKWSAGWLQTVATYKDAQGNLTNTSKQTFTLSTDRKILTILDERTFDGQTYTLTDVYDKQ